MYYLKYRPQTIGELDNPRIKDTLGKALLENNWSHAYLLTGTRGSGKTTTARLIAKIVNCTKRKKGEEPCNKCESCLAITAGRSLDVLEIDAASNTGVEDIRDLREKVKLAPTSSRYKVYIIDEVHMLSTSAFNALLKTLEEPPPDVIFILATTEAQKLPETITSRCLVYNFGKVGLAEIVSGLKKIAKEEKLKISGDVLEKIARLGNGSHRDSQKILEQLAKSSDSITLEHIEALNTQNNRIFAEQILEKIDKNQPDAALLIIQDFRNQNGRARELNTELINLLRDLLLKRNDIDVEVPEFNLPTDKIIVLITALIDAGALIRESPVPELPLELVIVESTSREIKKSETPPAAPPKTPPPTDLSDPQFKWPDVLTAIKPYNHSLVALLKASRPKEITSDTLILEVFYKFHKDKLSESKNREILEKVVSDIMGRELKIKYVLREVGENDGNV